MTTGSWPIVPPIKGIHSGNILLCKNFDHAKQIVAARSNAKKVAIIGAGYIGVELVEAFVNNGKKVTLVDALERPIPKYFDRDFTDIVENSLKSK